MTMIPRSCPAPSQLASPPCTGQLGLVAYRISFSRFAESSLHYGYILHPPGYRRGVQIRLGQNRYQTFPQFLRILIKIFCFPPHFWKIRTNFLQLQICDNETVPYIFPPGLVGPAACESGLLCHYREIRNGVTWVSSFESWASQHSTA